MSHPWELPRNAHFRSPRSHSNPATPQRPPKAYKPPSLNLDPSAAGDEFGQLATGLGSSIQGLGFRVFQGILSNFDVFEP